MPEPMCPGVLAVQENKQKQNQASPDSFSDPPMSAEDSQIQAAVRPPVLILHHLFYPLHIYALSCKYRLLKPWESPLPLHDFLQSEAQAVTALICSAVSARIDASTLESLPSLRFIFTTSAGVEHIDLKECKQRGISVAYAGTLYSEDTADCAVALLIDVLRKISAADRYVRRGLWAMQGDYPLGSKLGAKSVGIVGLGSIGSEIAKRLESFGCTISYTSRTKKSSVSFPYFASVRDLAANSDILIVCCALTSETYHIISKDVLLALGKGGIIVNVGRGALIDEKAMVKCLLEGEIGGAGLDVFENEPSVPPELYSLDNVVLSPHRSVLTTESTAELLQLMTANLEAFFSNESLVTPVPF